MTSLPMRLGKSFIVMVGKEKRGLMSECSKTQWLKIIRLFHVSKWSKLICIVLQYDLRIEELH